MGNEAPSNRSFGRLFTVVFTLLGLYTLSRGRTLYPWILGLAGLTAAVTMARPGWLTPFNRAWMAFGSLLHRVTSPLVLGVIFYGVFTPFGLAMRLAGRDSMKRRFEPATRTYWVDREPPGPAADSFRDQF